MRELDYLFLILVLIAFASGAYAVISSGRPVVESSVIASPSVVEGNFAQSAYFPNGIYCQTADAYRDYLAAQFPGETATAVAHSSIEGGDVLEISRIGDRTLFVLIENIADEPYYCPLFAGENFQLTGTAAVGE